MGDEMKKVKFLFTVKDNTNTQIEQKTYQVGAIAKLPQELVDHFLAREVIELVKEEKVLKSTLVKKVVNYANREKKTKK
jgi:hypothetical protein